MEIRDVIQGSIHVESWEIPVLDSKYFQRLRQIKQLGFGELSYPSANHNRYIHSLGAMKTAAQAFDSIFGGPLSQLSSAPIDKRALYRAAPEAHERFRAVLRLAALLHDSGHGPLSHTTEFAMPERVKLKLPDTVPVPSNRTQANHEDYTLKLILDSGLTPILEQAGAKLGFKPIHIAALVEPSIALHDDFFMETIEGDRISFRPILQQIISSEIDADRMDYLRRDSYYSGVTYGNFDFDWLKGNLCFHVMKNSDKGIYECVLALHHRALYAFEDFLLSRFNMFLMVYFHHKSVIYDEMLAQYFASPDCDYTLPADIEKYCEIDDTHLSTHLKNSSNPWAKRITERNAYRVLMELHSGIPATPTAAKAQGELYQKVLGHLKNQGIHCISTTSTGELSKYFDKPGTPIYVRYDNHYSAPTFIPLTQCTDLYSRYREKRVITRLYVAPENLGLAKLQSKNEPFKFEET